MRFKAIIVFFLIIALCTGCASKVSTDAVGSSGPALTDEQMELLGITQEEFDRMSEEEKAEKQAILDELEARKNATASTEAATAETVPAETEAIDVEADVQKYLVDLPPIPEGNREYSYDWSDRMDRITYYNITIDPAPEDEVNDFMYRLESDYGFMSDGKEEWDNETSTATYGYRTDTSIIYVAVTYNSDGTVKVTISISYNPFI